MRIAIERQPRYVAMLDYIGQNRSCARVGAESLCETVRRHVRRAAAGRHGTADRLGATPTNHLSRGARLTTATEEGVRAVVTVPIPGISRAFGAVTVRPRNAKALTLPVNAVAYGKRAPELAARGWDLFTLPSRQGPGAGILFGRKAGEARTVALYLLRSSATLPQDRGLMPSDDEMGEAIAYGVRMELERLRR